MHKCKCIPLVFSSVHPYMVNTHPSIYSCIYLSTYLYMHTPIHPSIHPSIHSSICLYMHTPIHPYIHGYMSNFPLHSSIDCYISLVFPSIHACIHPSIASIPIVFPSIHSVFEWVAVYSDYCCSVDEICCYSVFIGWFISGADWPQ